MMPPIINFLWLPDMPISNWNKNMTIWEIIGYLNFDNVCSKLGIISEYSNCLRMALSCAILGQFLYLILSILFTCTNFLIIIAFIDIIYYSYSIPSFILNIFNSIFNLWKLFFYTLY
ncbi:unnamed protein product [Blepharisma stoltei]|uniref:Uncharacterized protein n=1 Tax=Blepharisma stoltei TaxID=1481888 RepID=A0AAU9ICN3_9CILI|nr:unnamed protein product [Blepharisma stoltei]